MPQDHDDHVSRRHALECMIWTGSAVLWTVSGGCTEVVEPARPG